MKCIDYYDFVKKTYRRMYKLTLAFEKYNIDKAYEVYRDAVRYNLGVVEAIIKHYGYRYRRMENFLKELQLWSIKEGWILNNILVKVYASYKGMKLRDWIEIDSEIEVFAPIDEFFIAEDYFINLVLGTIYEEGYLVPISTVDIGVKCLGFTYLRSTKDLTTKLKILVIKAGYKMRKIEKIVTYSVREVVV